MNDIINKDDLISAMRSNIELKEQLIERLITEIVELKEKTNLLTLIKEYLEGKK